MGLGVKVELQDFYRYESEYFSYIFDFDKISMSEEELENFAKYNGLLLVHFTATAPSAVTATTPIFFETQGLLGSRKAVKKPGGGALTAGDITSPGYYLFFYDFTKGIVEAVGEFNATAPTQMVSEKVKSN